MKESKKRIDHHRGCHQSLSHQNPQQPSEIILCVDMHKANTAIQRETHVTPTINDMILNLNGAKVFFKLDLNAGYNQLRINAISRHSQLMLYCVDTNDLASKFRP